MRLHIIATPLLLLAFLTPLDAKDSPPLPPDAAAVVKGKVITMDQFREALVRRFAGMPDGKQILENYATDLAVEAERVRRGIEVTDADVDAYVKKVAQRVLKESGGTKSLDKVIAEKGVTKAQFRVIAHNFLVRERMAAQDLDQTGEVSSADLEVWIESLKKKAGVEVGTKDLPKGVFAKVGDHEVDAAEYGQALLENLPSSRLEGVLWDLAISIVVEQRLKKAGVTVTEKDKDAAIARLASDFHHDPRFRNAKISFAKAFETLRHMTLAEWKEDPIFLSQVGLAKMLRASLTQEEVKAYWKKHHARYGEVRDFVHLLIRGSDRPSPFGHQVRSMKAAKAKIEAILDRYRSGESFEALLKKESEARSKSVRPQDPIEVTRATTMPKALKDVVFSSPVGEVEGPIRTAYGYHLVKVLSIKPAPTFEKVYSRVVRDIVLTKRSHELLEIRQDPDIHLRFGQK